MRSRAKHLLSILQYLLLTPYSFNHNQLSNLLDDVLEEGSVRSLNADPAETIQSLFHVYSSCGDVIAKKYHIFVRFFMLALSFCLWTVLFI